MLKGTKTDKIVPAGSAGTGYDQSIDGQGGYLTPGLIDVHVLMRGVTTVHDVAGNTFALKRAIDNGVIP